MNGISNGDGTYKPLSNSDALVGFASDLPYPQKSITENIKELLKTTTVSVSKTISASDDYGITIPNESGYIPIGCFLDGSDTARSSCLLGNPIHGASITVRLKNLTNASVSVNATLYVIWCKA